MATTHGDINGFDFWGEAAFPKWSDHSVSTFGRTVFRTVNDIQGGADGGSLEATFDLVAPTGVIAEEIQTYRFEGGGQSRIIDCEFAIHATHGPIVMGDTKEGTFAIRVVKALDSPPGHMENASGASGEKAIWAKRSNWVDYYGRVAGEDVGLAIFDHPDNLRAPTYWHARAYGLPRRIRSASNRLPVTAVGTGAMIFRWAARSSCATACSSITGIRLRPESLRRTGNLLRTSR